MHNAGLIATIAAALGGALLLGYGAKRIGVSPILGYLLAGIVIGPYTPGLVADRDLAAQLAEVGVVLLMFGVGLHFSFADLLRVRRIAVAGALGQSAVATALGLVVGLLWGWSFGAGLVLGLALSVASTVVLVRGLIDRGLLDTPHGHAAVGWLVVEDLLTVLVLVLLPALTRSLDGSATNGLLLPIAVAVGKVVLLGGIVLTVGSRVVPWLLVKVARAESRELFTLAVIAVALGIAYGSAALFDVSMALGAFLAGMVVAQSELSHRAAADALPLRDAFSVLFFVSVGMLFDPRFVVQEPGLFLATLAIVLVAKPVTACLIVLVLGHPVRTALTAAVGLAQVGEFSFILADLGRSLGVFPAQGQSTVLAAAIVSIALNPFLFRSLGTLERWFHAIPLLRRRSARAAEAHLPGARPAASLAGHAVVCGAGRVGMVLALLLQERGWPFVVIEQERRLVERLRREGMTVVEGDAANPDVLDLARPGTARLLLVAVADPVATHLAVAHAARVNPDLAIVARVDSEADARRMRPLGRVTPVIGTLESAVQMSRHLMQGFGTGPLEAEAALFDLRLAHGLSPDGVGHRFAELAVRDHSTAVGKTIAHLGLPAGLLIVLVRRGGDSFVPSGTTRVLGGDTLIAITDAAGLAQASAVLT